MKIWKIDFALEALNASSVGTLGESMKIEFIAAGDDYLQARMPVFANTVQPMRILHGGASVALAETVGSVASLLCLSADSNQYAVGLDINANHLRSVVEGSAVIATCRPLHIGRTTHVWQIEIQDEQSKKLACVSRLTMAIVQR